MYKKEITYEDFDGNKVTETHYFNLTKTELIDIETGIPGGLSAAVERIMQERDNGKLIQEFKKIVLASYGVRSDDGRRFIKNSEIREEFTQTLAYDALFIELATDANAAAAFISGVVPKDLAEEVNKAVATQQLPPPPPAA